MKILTEYKMNDLTLKNRVVMAPMTRSRALDTIPNDLMAEYYGQRASAGLIITEGSQVNNHQARGYIDTPGIHSLKQVEEWKKITEAVHKKEGRIFLQLWHVGAVSHPFFQADGDKAVSASNFNALSKVYTPEGFADTPDAREMRIDEIVSTVKDFGIGAANSMKAGFDGVEIHSSNGYLLHQFISPHSNKRSDEYGGSIENRCRIVFEVIDEIRRNMPENRIGIRFNPSMHNLHGSMITEETIPAYDYLIKRLNEYDLAYIHLSEPFNDVTNVPHSLVRVAERYRRIYKGTIITNTGHTLETGTGMLEKNLADLVSFGIPFISNPDLVERFRNGAPLAAGDRKTFYGGGAKGYTDYPFMK